ncbi:unnamed protein product [Symbiodinium sp. CCMP2456]|nr:unnamed protein product [Symbiodinium sp. CCMP2456]
MLTSSGLTPETWSQMVQEAAHGAADLFEEKVEATYSKKQLHKWTLDECRSIDADNYVMKSKYRRQMFQHVERQLPILVSRELGQAIDDMVSRIEQQLTTEWSASQAHGSVALSHHLLEPLRHDLGLLRTELQKAVQDEEMEQFRKNLAAAGLVVVGMAVLGGVGGGVGAAAASVVAPVAAVGGHTAMLGGVLRAKQVRG